VSTFHAAACAEIMEALTKISVAAAAAIRRYGNNDIRMKADGSPVTAADEAAEDVIRSRLARLEPALPVIAEERAELDKRVAPDACYFLVDPLDGTRDFIAGHNEYTINIGLMDGGAPTLGIITAPALGWIWRGQIGRGAERLRFAGDNISAARAIQTRPRPHDGLHVMVSRSHLDPRTQAYVDSLPHAQRTACGSSLKFCRLAEGAADLYPRLAPTCDWDVAAGHAILAAAGGSVAEPAGTALVYGTADLRIPAFIASGRPEPRRTQPRTAPDAAKNP
jgi:3'(2'), 5'-bisphosphate nucleotidase